MFESMAGRSGGASIRESIIERRRQLGFEPYADISRKVSVHDSSTVDSDD